MKEPLRPLDNPLPILVTSQMSGLAGLAIVGSQPDPTEVIYPGTF